MTTIRPQRRPALVIGVVLLDALCTSSSSCQRPGAHAGARMLPSRLPWLIGVAARQPVCCGRSLCAAASTYVTSVIPRRQVGGRDGHADEAVRARSDRARFIGQRAGRGCGFGSSRSATAVGAAVAECGQLGCRQLGAPTASAGLPPFDALAGGWTSRSSPEWTS